MHQIHCELFNPRVLCAQLTPQVMYCCFSLFWYKNFYPNRARWPFSIKLTSLYWRCRSSCSFSLPICHSDFKLNMRSRHQGLFLYLCFNQAPVQNEVKDTASKQIEVCKEGNAHLSSLCLWPRFLKSVLSFLSLYPYVICGNSAICTICSAWKSNLFEW